MAKSIVLVVSLVVLSACGGGDDTGASVSDVWARATVPGASVGAVYFDLEVSNDDTLIGVAVPPEVAGQAEIHVSAPAEASGEMSDEMGDMGAMQMQVMPDGLPLTGGTTVSFEPGGYHVMLPDLVEPLTIGDVFELTLDFATADDVTVTVEIAETAP